MSGTFQVLSGKEANSVFGQVFTPPKPDRPEANGHRVMFSPCQRAGQRCVSDGDVDL